MEQIHYELRKDPFFSESNIKALEESIEQMKQGKTVTKTFEELEEMECCTKPNIKL